MRHLAQMIQNAYGKIPNVSMLVHLEKLTFIVILIQNVFGIRLCKTVMLIFAKILKLTQIVKKTQNVYGQKLIQLNAKMIHALLIQMGSPVGRNQNVNGQVRIARLMLVIPISMSKLVINNHYVLGQISNARFHVIRFLQKIHVGPILNVHMTFNLKYARMMLVKLIQMKVSAKMDKNVFGISTITLVLMTDVWITRLKHHVIKKRSVYGLKELAVQQMLAHFKKVHQNVKRTISAFGTLKIA
jgi:hypothetical protein